MTEDKDRIKLLRSVLHQCRSTFHSYAAYYQNKHPSEPERAAQFRESEFLCITALDATKDGVTPKGSKAYCRYFPGKATIQMLLDADDASPKP